MARGDVVQQIKAESHAEVSKEKEPKATIPTGLTMLNLALANHSLYGYREGSIVNIIGDSHSGKSLLALSCLATAACSPKHDEFRLIYDDAENANSFDMGALFGQKLVARLESPPGLDEEFPNSRTIEEFHDNLARVLKENRPFIYVLDSLDSIGSEAEHDKLEDNRIAREKGKEIKGSYGMDKAKKLSELFRNVVGDMSQSRGLLIVVSQTRDNIDPMAFGSKKTVAGGRALEFYASIRMWLAHTGKLTADKGTRKYQIGNATKIKVSKNKYTGRQREVAFQSFYDLGLDDVGSVVDWLILEEFWKKAGTKIQADDIGLEMARKQLITTIETEGLEDKLYRIAGKRWKQLEDSLLLHRKSRFE